MFFSREMARGSKAVGHDHVAIGTGALVEVGALGQPERLRDVDLDVGDVVSVPDRLEEAVGEAEGEDVLGGLLAQEVVDPEDLVLIEDLVQPGIERHRGHIVGAEGLLHDDPRAASAIVFTAESAALGGTER